MVFSFCIYSGSCTLALWWRWPVLQVKTSCQIINISKRLRCVWRKTSLCFWTPTETGKLHIKKIKTTWKTKICLFISYYILSTFQCASRQPISVADLGRWSLNHVNHLIPSRLQNLCLLNFNLSDRGKGEGRGMQGRQSNPLRAPMANLPQYETSHLRTKWEKP